MKRILLTTTALVMTAGVAAADVSFSGTATLGYNNESHDGSATTGMYTDGDLNISMSQALDNGMTASASFEIDYWDSKTGGVNAGNSALAATDSVLTLASDTVTLNYGDTQNAGKNSWTATGSMDQDTFRTQDGENVLRGDFTMAGMTAAVSTSQDATDDSALSAGLKGDLGGMSVALAYQAKNTLSFDADDNSAATQNSVMGLRIGTTLAGADLGLGYAKNDAGNSTGVSVSMPVSSVTLTASYVMESVGDNNWDVSIAYSENGVGLTVATDERSDWNADVSYDMGNGMSMFAGLDDGGDDQYAGVTYDLGGNASVLASYAKDGDNDDTDDEIGEKAYKEGMTVALSFAF